MKMGIKEFRERISEVAEGDEVVVVTHHGKPVGRFIPERLRQPKDIDIEEWAREREEAGRRWRSMTPDWRERLRAFGIPEEEIAELEEMDRCS
jgi:antitoxin (DNA-binding transcriptional repressor) of toxin-antitoxin stability system